MQSLDLRPLETLSFEPGIYRKTFFSTILSSLDVEKFETRSRDVIVCTEITAKDDRFNLILTREKNISQNLKQIHPRKKFLFFFLTHPRKFRSEKKITFFFSKTLDPRLIPLRRNFFFLNIRE